MEKSQLKRMGQVAVRFGVRSDAVTRFEDVRVFTARALPLDGEHLDLWVQAFTMAGKLLASRCASLPERILVCSCGAEQAYRCGDACPSCGRKPNATDRVRAVCEFQQREHPYLISDGDSRVAMLKELQLAGGILGKPVAGLVVPQVLCHLTRGNEEQELDGQEFLIGVAAAAETDVELTAILAAAGAPQAGEQLRAWLLQAPLPEKTVETLFLRALTLRGHIMDGREYYAPVEWLKPEHQNPGCSIVDGKAQAWPWQVFAMDGLQQADGKLVAKSVEIATGLSLLTLPAAFPELEVRQRDHAAASLKRYNERKQREEGEAGWENPVIAAPIAKKLAAIFVAQRERHATPVEAYVPPVPEAVPETAGGVVKALGLAIPDNPAVPSQAVEVTDEQQVAT